MGLRRSDLARFVVRFFFMVFFLRREDIIILNCVRAGTD